MGSYEPYHGKETIQSTVSVPSRGMGGFLQMSNKVSKIVKDAVSVPPQGMGGVLQVLKKLKNEGY